MSRYDVERKKWDEKSAEMLKQEQDWGRSKPYDEVFTRSNTLRPVYEFFTRIGEPGITILDYGCGAGWTALPLATKAERVHAFDISEGRIAIVEKLIAYNKVNNVEVVVANGEDLPYADKSFDYIFGNAILHHITLDKCLPEIARVLKPGGRAAFCEPLAHNPLINLYRYIKHHYFEVHLGTDQPLKYSDFPTFQSSFPRVEFIESSFMRRRIPLLITPDRLLLRVPFLRRYVSYVSILLEKHD